MGARSSRSAVTRPSTVIPSSSSSSSSIAPSSAVLSVSTAPTPSPPPISVPSSSSSDIMVRCDLCNAAWNHLEYQTAPSLIDCDITRECRRAPFLPSSSSLALASSSSSSAAKSSTAAVPPWKQPALTPEAVSTALAAMKKMPATPASSTETKIRVPLNRGDDEDNIEYIITDIMSIPGYNMTDRLLNVLNGYIHHDARKRFMSRANVIRYVQDLLAAGADANYLYRGTSMLAHAIINDHCMPVIESLLHYGAIPSPIYPSSDHLTLAAAVNPSVACILIDGGAPVSRAAMIALLMTRTSMHDDTRLLERLIDGGIDPTMTHTITSAVRASTIPSYMTLSRYALGSLLVARAPPTEARDVTMRASWPEDKITDAWHPVVVTDIGIAWNKALCIRIRFLKFRGHYDEWLDPNSPRLQPYDEKVHGDAPRATSELASSLIHSRGGAMLTTMNNGVATLHLRHHVAAVIASLTLPVSSSPSSSSLLSSSVSWLVSSSNKLHIPAPLVDVILSYVTTADTAPAPTYIHTPEWIKNTFVEEEGVSLGHLQSLLWCICGLPILVGGPLLLVEWYELSPLMKNALLGALMMPALLAVTTVGLFQASDKRKLMVIMVCMCALPLGAGIPAWFLLEHSHEAVKYIIALTCSGPPLGLLIILWAIAGRRSTLWRQVAWISSIFIVIPSAVVATLMIFGYDSFDDEEHFWTWTALAAIVGLGLISIIVAVVRARYCIPVHIEYEDLGAVSNSPQLGGRHHALPALASEHARRGAVTSAMGSSATAAAVVAVVGGTRPRQGSSHGGATVAVAINGGDGAGGLGSRRGSHWGHSSSNISRGVDGGLPSLGSRMLAIGSAVATGAQNLTGSSHDMKVEYDLL